jgi:surface antigen
VLNSLARIKVNMIKINKQGQVSEDNHNIGIKNCTWWVRLHIISSGQGLVAGCFEQRD